MGFVPTGLQGSVISAELAGWSGLRQKEKVLLQRKQVFDLIQPVLNFGTAHLAVEQGLEQSDM